MVGCRFKNLNTTDDISSKYPFLSHTSNSVKLPAHSAASPTNFIKNNSETCKSKEIALPKFLRRNNTCRSRGPGEIENVSLTPTVNVFVLLFDLSIRKEYKNHPTRHH